MGRREKILQRKIWFEEGERGREREFGLGTLYIEREHTWLLEFEAELEIWWIFYYCNYYYLLLFLLLLLFSCHLFFFCKKDICKLCWEHPDSNNAKHYHLYYSWNNKVSKFSRIITSFSFWFKILKIVN